MGPDHADAERDHGTRVSVTCATKIFGMDATTTIQRCERASGAMAAERSGNDLADGATKIGALDSESIRNTGDQGEACTKVYNPGHHNRRWRPKVRDDLDKVAAEKAVTAADGATTRWRSSAAAIWHNWLRPTEHDADLSTCDG